MKVVKWGNSLAIRLPAELVKAMGWKVGDDIEIRAAPQEDIAAPAPADRKAAIEQLHKFSGAWPADFGFDREEAHSRGPDNPEREP
jgi:antitoxin MazE